MLYYQNSSGMPASLQSNGCYFMSLLFKEYERFRQQDIIDLWNGAHDRKFIDSQDIIQDPQGLVDYLDLGLKYRDKHFEPGEIEIIPGMYVIEQWFNPNNGFIHFLKGPGDGSVAEYDPIKGGSKTRREGYLHGLRIYDEA